MSILQRPIVKAALAIGELAYTLNNVCNDDGIKVSDLSDDQIVSEACYVLSLFDERGTLQREMLDGECGPSEQRYARENVKKLNALISKFA